MYVRQFPLIKEITNTLGKWMRVHGLIHRGSIRQINGDINSRVGNVIVSEDTYVKEL